MPDPRHDRLAEVLVDYSTEVGEGDLVMVEAPLVAAPLVREVYRRVLQAGAHPRTHIKLDGLEETALFEGTEAQLDWIDPTHRGTIEQGDAWIVIDATSNTRRLTNLDPARFARATRAREKLQNRYLERAAGGEFHWVLSLYPTNAAAQDAEMSLAEFEELVYGAGLLDREDPSHAWREFGERIERIGSFLEQKRELRVVAEDTDLMLGVEGRSWVRSKGLRNFPDGEVFTGPVETSVEGTIRFTYPAVFRGREVEDVRLRFSGGEVVEASAKSGEDFLREMIALDEGSKRAGEFAFGLNEGLTGFTRNLLLDEKIGGTVHLALGTSYPASGGKNRSSLHWDLICDLRDGGEVYADGELVYRDGRFLDGL